MVLRVQANAKWSDLERPTESYRTLMPEPKTIRHWTERGYSFARLGEPKESDAS